MCWYILIMLFWYQKRINALRFFLLLLRIFFKVVTEDRSIPHVFDEDIDASEIFSFRFVLCSVWQCLEVHRRYTGKFLWHYSVLLLASVSCFLLLCTPFCIDCTFILSIYRYSVLLHNYFKARISILYTWVIISFSVKNKLCI